MADFLTIADVIARDPTMPDLTVRQYAILDTLAQYRSVHFGLVAARFPFSKPVLHRALTVFKNAGWITQLASTSDRRRQSLSLTESGRQMVARLRSAGARRHV